MNRPDRIGVVADDLTGGASIAGELVREGWLCDVVRLGQPAPAEASLVIETASRFLRSSEAASRVREATADLQEAGYELTMKKFDSSLKGNVSPELEAYAQSVSGPVVYTPACPAAGISVRKGILRGGDGTGATISTLLSGEISGRSRPLSLDVLRRGPHEIATWFKSASEEFIVADAETDTDLEALAQGALTAGIRAFAGTYGLGSAIARCSGAHALPPGPLPRAKQIAIVVGSASRHAGLQVEDAVRAGADELVVDVRALLSGHIHDEVERVRNRAAASESRIIVIHTSPSTTRDYVAIAGASAGWNERDLALLFALPMAAAIQARPGTALVFVGGETTGAVADQIDLSRLGVVGEFRPGMPVGFDPLGRWPAIITKPGSFGSETVLTDIAHALLARKAPGSIQVGA